MIKIKKIKIFISAYACEPNYGSEIGVGWNWILQMSEYYELWVLTRKSNRNNIENFFKHNRICTNINFIYFDLSKKLTFWKKGTRGVRLYYSLWQYFSDKIVKQTMIENEIEIYHLLTYGNSSYPCSNYGKKQFFIWGPTSAGDIIERDFSKHYTIKWRVIELLRRISVNLLKFNPGFISRCNNADLILCKTMSTFKSIPDNHKHKAELFTDVAVSKLDSEYINYCQKKSKNIIRFLAAGSLVGWRGFDILIESFATAANHDKNILLTILGKGTERNRLQNLIDELKMNKHIKLAGQLKISEYYQQFSTSDVAINPCLKEGAVTFSFDSMSFGKPLICIDTGGYTRYFSDKNAIVLERTTRKELIISMTKAILNLTNKSLISKLGKNASLIGSNLNWNNKGKEINQIIKKYYYK